MLIINYLYFFIHFRNKKKNKMRSLAFKPLFKIANLKSKLTEILPRQVENFKNIRKKYGGMEVSSLTVNSIIGGCQTVQALYYEGSLIDRRTVCDLFFLLSFFLCCLHI